tara:strand:+ start:615 stop:905 length:291 start_codon:yes stop_codon:yes gene_type:complete
MQDFAKTRPVAERKLTHPEGEWKIDVGSVLLGVLLGAVVVFVGLKAAEYREIQPSHGEVVETTAIVERDIDFEFYQVLKRDELYPARQNFETTYQN